MRIVDWSSDVCSSDLADLPGVEQNLREHNSVSLAKFVNIPTMSAELGPLKLVRHMLDYMLFHRGLPTTPAVQVMAAFRTDPALADPDIILSMLPVAVTFNDKGDARSEERRVGKECVSTCRSRRPQYH